MSEKRADKYQAKQQVHKMAEPITADKGKIVATLTKNQEEAAQSAAAKKQQSSEVAQKHLELETAKNKTAVMSNPEPAKDHLVGAQPDERSTPVRLEQAAMPAAPQPRPRPQKMLTPYEKIIKIAASEARTFNRDFDFHMRQKNREYFQA